MTEPTERIAILETNYASLARRAEDHEKNDMVRYDHTLERMEEIKTEILECLEKLDTSTNSIAIRVGQLWDEKNRREGALGVGKIAAGAIGGLFGGAGVAFLDWWSKKPPTLE